MYKWYLKTKDNTLKNPTILIGLVGLIEVEFILKKSFKTEDAIIRFVFNNMQYIVDEIKINNLKEEINEKNNINSNT